MLYAENYSDTLSKVQWIKTTTTVYTQIKKFLNQYSVTFFSIYRKTTTTFLVFYPVKAMIFFYGILRTV